MWLYTSLVTTTVLFFDRLADEWIPTDQLEPVRQVPLEQLSPEAKQVVSQLCYPTTTRPRKHKRKSSSCPKSLELTKAVWS